MHNNRTYLDNPFFHGPWYEQFVYFHRLTLTNTVDAAESLLLIVAKLYKECH